MEELIKFILTFFYVKVPVGEILVENERRQHKRYTLPKFEVKFETGDRGHTGDWSLSGIKLFDCKKRYKVDQDIVGELYHGHDKVGEFTGTIISRNNQKSGLKIKFINKDRYLQRYFNSLGQQ
jgi:hypothetical protein